MPNKLIIALAVLILTLGSPPAVADSEQEPRLALYGLALAYPVELPYFPGRRILTYIWDVTPLDLTLSINKKGEVKKIEFEAECDTLMVDYCHDYLSALKFYPAIRETKSVDSKLSVHILFRRGRYFPEFIFPIDTALFVADHKLLNKAYEANGIIAPKLLSFPSYSGILDPNDSSLIYKYIVLRTEIDSNGILTDLQIAKSTYPDFNLQLKSASLYAEFSPAIIQGKPAASVAYLVVSFFPRLSYPLRPWELSGYDLMSPQKKATVRLLADTAGIICPPIPRRHAGDTITIPGLISKYPDTTSYTLKFDTLGRARYFLEKKILQRGRVAMNRVIDMIAYYPAITIDGNPVKFEGPARFYFSNSTSVRVEYSWLQLP